VLPVSLLTAAAIDRLALTQNLSLKQPQLAYTMQHARLLYTLRYVLVGASPQYSALTSVQAFA